MRQTLRPPLDSSAGFLTRLGRDTSGNVLAIVAASLFPMLALIGGGVDMGRAYLAQSRLQQACDAGVLAARKRLGIEVTADGSVPASVAEEANRFFNLNYRDGAYGSDNRKFAITVGDDFSISATASVDVPTTVMAVFDQDTMEVSVDCTSIQHFNDLDIMMVVDTTGSMRHTNAGDSQSRLESLKQVVRNFYTKIDSNKTPQTRIRYGFVPYASNVNVGHLLQDDWVVQSWKYQGREETGFTVPGEDVSYTYYDNWQYVSGTRSEWAQVSSYDATYYAPSGVDEGGYYRCEGTQPADSWATSSVDDTTTAKTTVQTDPPAAVNSVNGTKTHNGTRYRTRRDGNKCYVESSTDVDFVQTYSKHTVVPSLDQPIWRYKQITRNVANWRTEQKGCIEERDTYAITDYANVDFTKALDLDLDRIPTPGNAATQWRPRYPEEIFVRKIEDNGDGDFFTPMFVSSTNYVQSGTWWFSDCPPAASGLTEMSSSQLDSYLDTLVPFGATYHDIGMIWGGRLLSPTGLFASANQPRAGRELSRHMIWLTDGQTEPFDLAYGAYGIDGLDQRRWSPKGKETLTSTIEKRFGVACEQVKNRNITVWVIAFGTTLNPIMEQCAGVGRSFQASNADELNEAFMEIAGAMSELRITN